MKKTVGFILSVLAIGLISFNLNVNSNNSLKNDLSLQNIKSLQVSAGEMYCDLKTSVECTITNGNQTGKSIGYLICLW